MNEEIANSIRNRMLDKYDYFYNAVKDWVEEMSVWASKDCGEVIENKVWKHQNSIEFDLGDQFTEYVENECDEQT